MAPVTMTPTGPDATGQARHLSPTVTPTLSRTETRRAEVIRPQRHRWSNRLTPTSRTLTASTADCDIGGGPLLRTLLSPLSLPLESVNRAARRRQPARDDASNLVP